ncbi:hypothetical protein [Tateyamaria omphalii]|uniref:hypothetical protein n=1 Tax=Tateyamaria omphalii TaxID=299262 RepID=UPI0012F97C05|nr:hypothetical protein [Tateyamaria omphalii]
MNKLLLALGLVFLAFPGNALAEDLFAETPELCTLSRVEHQGRTAATARVKTRGSATGLLFGSFHYSCRARFDETWAKLELGALFVFLSQCNIHTDRYGGPSKKTAVSAVVKLTEEKMRLVVNLDGEPIRVDVQLCDG